MIPRTHGLAALAAALLIAVPAPTPAQERPALAHHVGEPAATSSRDLTAGVSHDPDSDGALLGAAIGAGSLGLLSYSACDAGNLCVYSLIGGALIGGLAGLVVGGLIDAADPRGGVADVVPDAAPDSTRTAEPRRTSRRNDAIGAVAGALSFGYLLSGSGAALAGAVIGGIVGAGIGSAIPEQATQGGS